MTPGALSLVFTCTHIHTCESVCALQPRIEAAHERLVLPSFWNVCHPPRGLLVALGAPSSCILLPLSWGSKTSSQKPLPSDCLVLSMSPHPPCHSSLVLGCPRKKVVSNDHLSSLNFCLRSYDIFFFFNCMKLTYPLTYSKGFVLFLYVVQVSFTSSLLLIQCHGHNQLFTTVAKEGRLTVFQEDF